MRVSLFLSCATLGAALSISACRSEPQQEPSSNEQANAAATKTRLPVAEAPLDRAALLVAAAKAASATALGQNDAAEQRTLDGKRFEVRIRFGCPATPQEQGDSGPFRVAFNESDRTLRIRAAPDLSQSDPLIAGLAGEAIEAVEGFWLRRPWLLADGCPAPPPAAEPAEGEEPAEKEKGPRPTKAQAPAPAKAQQEPPAPAPEQQLGLAEFFTEADSRIGRRDDRAYEATKVLPAGTAPSPKGYNLVLSGRLRQLPQGRVITCVAADPDKAPQCVISAQFDRVWIEAPGGSETLAEWSR